MKRLSLFTFLILFLFLYSCKKGDIVQPTSHKLVQGIWQGSIDSTSLDITFIEGEFEDSPTVTGSAHITNNDTTLFYLIMNGTDDGAKTVQFSLYKVPVVTKEDYHMKGTRNGATINGTFQELNQNGDIIKSGKWNVKRIP